LAHEQPYWVAAKFLAAENVGMAHGHVEAEFRRLQKNWEFAAEWQITAAGFWLNIQFFLGAAAAALAAVSSGTAFAKKSVIAGSFAAAAAIAAAVLASLRPAERAERHQRSAGDYHALAVDVRLYREHEIVVAKIESPDELKVLEWFENRGKAIENDSPWAPRRLVGKTQVLIAKGRRYYDNDGSSVAPEGIPSTSRAASAQSRSGVQEGRESAPRQE
jgi:hypothetical protein